MQKCGVTGELGKASVYTLFQNGRQANWPLWPRLRLNILLNLTFESEAIRANLHGNKRILKWRPFWNKVYIAISLEAGKMSQILCSDCHWSRWLGVLALFFFLFLFFAWLWTLPVLAHKHAKLGQYSAY